jgi:hypothetical protein
MQSFDLQFSETISSLPQGKQQAGARSAINKVNERLKTPLKDTKNFIDGFIFRILASLSQIRVPLTDNVNNGADSLSQQKVSPWFATRKKMSDSCG